MNSFEMRTTVATKASFLSCFHIDPAPSKESLFFLFDNRSYVQLRITRTAQKTIKTAKSQSRLRAIGTERLNLRLWRTEIFLLGKKSHQSTAARVFLT